MDLLNEKKNSTYIWDIFAIDSKLYRKVLAKLVLPLLGKQIQKVISILK